MGFFSWKTADTGESIANVHAGHQNSWKTVYLLQPDGKPPIAAEGGYLGYGDFGDVDAYEWLADANNIPATHADRRLDGIYGRKGALEFPLKFSFDKDAVYEDLPASDDCEHQGYFYGG